MTFWWLSFCDPNRPTGSQFLGVAIVEQPEGSNVGVAAMAAGLLGCNPGGEVLGYPWSECEVPAKFVGRLLTKDEATYVDGWMAQRYAENAIATPDVTDATLRVRDALYDGLLVRRGRILDEATARERANNLATAVMEVLAQMADERKRAFAGQVARHLEDIADAPPVLVVPSLAEDEPPPVREPIDWNDRRIR